MPCCKLLGPLLCGLVLFAKTADAQESLESTPVAHVLSTLRSLTIAPEGLNCNEPYDQQHYSFPAALEEGLVQTSGLIYGPYTGTHFASTTETDIDHIVAPSEAHDSGLCNALPAVRRSFAVDSRNLTLASRSVSRRQKAGKDAAEWLPELNRCWFADRVIAVRKAYDLTIDRNEYDALARVLQNCDSVALQILPPQPPAAKTTINPTIAIPTLIVLMMFVQHLLITRQSETPKYWRRTLRRYRRHMRLPRYALILFPASATILLVDYSSGAQLNVLAQLSDAINRTGPTTVLMVTFFSSVLRLFVERTIGDSRNILSNTRDFMHSHFCPDKLRARTLADDAPKTVLNPRPDAWLLWLGCSLAITLLQYLLDLQFFGSQRAYPVDASGLSPALLLVVGLVATTIVCLGYYCWIYTTLFITLTDKHHYTGRVARLFLGDVGNNELPEQALLIGPVLAGKTTFHRQMPGSQASSRPQVAYEIVRKDEHTVCLYVVDMPGENMGDHLFSTSLIRADSLVLILRAEWFDLRALGDSSNYELDSWHNLIKDCDSREISNVKAYMRGLHFATKSTLVKPKDLFLVRSFVLYMNITFSLDDPSAKRVLSPVLDAWRDFQRLSKRIGDRFGAGEREGERERERENSCFLVGNATYREHGMDVLFQIPSDRAKRNLELIRDVPSLASMAQAVLHREGGE